MNTVSRIFQDQHYKNQNYNVYALWFCDFYTFSSRKSTLSILCEPLPFERSLAVAKGMLYGTCLVDLKATPHKSNLKPRWITSPHGVRISLDSRSQSVNFSRNLRSLTEKSRKSSSLSVKGINLLVKTLPSIKRSSVWTAAHGSNVKGESTTSPRCKVTIGPPTFLKIKLSCCGCVNK